MLRILCLLFMPLIVCLTANSQSDSLQLEGEDEIINSAPNKLRPMVGLGIGTFTFYGDTGNKTETNNPFNSSLALSLGVQVPVNYFLDLSFSAVLSTVTVNEPGLDMLNNFQSEITGGTALLTYNFENFLPKSTYLQPYIGTGISSFEFLSKADLFDAQGNEYNLWSDGSLMSLPESAPNVHDAIMVKRDYVYETDLRGLNKGENGTYPDRTISIPLSAGVNFKFSKHLKGQLGTTLFFNMNDLADNVNDSGSSSDGKKDRFLHSSLSLSYDLHIPTKKKPNFDVEFDENGEEFLSYELWDSDKDGVADLDDDCLGHPEGINVDEKGCPLDFDNDGVADYKDDEPATENGWLVDEYGVAIEDEIFFDQYMAWMDSLGTGEFDELYSRVDGEKSKQNFTVLILPDKRGMKLSEINFILAQENVRSVTENGEDGFLVGDFETLPEAVNKKITLEAKGLTGSVQKEINGDRVDINNDIDAMFEVMEERSRTIGDYEGSDNIVYRVQVGAYKYELSEDIFTGLDDLLVLFGEDGLTRYMTESFRNTEDANQRKQELLVEGFEDAFMTAYSNGSRIELPSSGNGVMPKEEILLMMTKIILANLN
ncbi:MAG: hypothetical protein ACI8QW_000489 [Saprospiraceae bacterium]|jgi:hypothetical protein